MGLAGPREARECAFFSSLDAPRKDTFPRFTWGGLRPQKTPCFGRPLRGDSALEFIGSPVNCHPLGCARGGIDDCCRSHFSCFAEKQKSRSTAHLQRSIAGVQKNRIRHWRKFLILTQGASSLVKCFPNWRDSAQFCIVR